MEEGKKKEENTEERLVVVFELGKEEFGVNINEVKEIIRMEEITKIPNSADFISGVINLRGGIIVIVNLAKKLSLEEKQNDKNTRILVVENGNNMIGMIVDSATEVLRLSDKQIEEAPPIITQKINADYIEGVGVLSEERLLILLDLVKVLGGAEIQQASNFQPNA